MLELEREKLPYKSLNDFMKIVYNTEIDLERIHKVAEKHFKKLLDMEKKFAIISIDMQIYFLEKINTYFISNGIKHPYGKIRTLIEYHSKLKKFCEERSVDFIEIDNKEIESSIFRNRYSIFFEKLKNYIDDEKFYEFLSKKEIENVFCIGVYRNQCVIDSIENISKRSYKTYTSFIGTANYQFESTNKTFKEQSQRRLRKFVEVCDDTKTTILDYDISRLKSLLKRILKNE